MEEKVITKTTVNGETYKLKDEDAARSGELSEEIANREAADSQIGAELGQKQDALTETQLAAVNSGIDATKVTQIDTNATSIDAIEEKVPAQASSSNQLADKNFVNSSIQTQTAHFRGNWGNWAAVPTDATLYPADDDGNHEPTSNDYMVLQDASDFPVAEGEPALAGTWRFKYSGTWATVGKNGWHPEYQVNETPLTSDQLAALNSGITQQAVEKLAGIPADAEANTIDSISVNGTAVTPDANKNVDLTIEGGIKTLTTEDYNYPANNPDRIRLETKEVGVYVTGEDLYIEANAQYQTETRVLCKTGTVIIVSYFGNIPGGKHGLVLGSRYARLFLTGVATDYPGDIPSVDVGGLSARVILLGKDIYNKLDSTNFGKVLDARQGKVLADRIGDLSTLTTTAKTSTVAAINEIVTSIGNVESALNVINNGGN